MRAGISQMNDELLPVSLFEPVQRQFICADAILGVIRTTARPYLLNFSLRPADIGT
jgi:hypothetical protein